MITKVIDAGGNGNYTTWAQAQDYLSNISTGLSALDDDITFEFVTSASSVYGNEDTPIYFGVNPNGPQLANGNRIRLTTHEGYRNVPVLLIGSNIYADYLDLAGVDLDHMKIVNSFYTKF